ncbi:MAG: phenylalanine--tRNA ligase subunit alpha, partial [Sulfolobaceae archaeon]
MYSEGELKIINFLKQKNGKSNLEELSTQLNLPKSSVISLLELLKSKGIVEVKRFEKIIHELTEEGYKRLREGLPEDLLIKKLGGKPRPLKDLKDEMGKDFDIAVGWAKRKGLIKIEGGMVIPLIEDYTSPEINFLRNPENAPQDVLRILEQRNLIKRVEILNVEVELLRQIEKEEEYLTFLTSDLLKTGKWRNYKLREYNVTALPPYVPIGKKHFMVEFLEKVREVMKELGFREVSSDYVELEFYNFDLLFQPQDHPAREIHDNFSVQGVGRIVDENLMQNVKKVHEEKWKYKWSEDISKKLVLRSQTTATTARIIASRPKIPIRVFTIGKVFRPDKIDATHLIEFHQMDGLIIEEGFNFRKLLGLLKEIHERLGIKKIKFKPAYFPFTEPSVEVYGYLEKLGWVEVCGAGLLRPEVVKPAGIDEVAGAWGMGLERIAMAFLGVNDIRLLYA